MSVVGRQDRTGRRVVRWHGWRGWEVVRWQFGKRGRVVRWQVRKDGRVARWEVSCFVYRWEMQGETKISSFYF